MNSEGKGRVYREKMTDTESKGPEEATLTDEQYFEKVIPQLSLKMNHLNSVNDFVSKECLDDLNFLQGASRFGTFAQRSKIADELTSLGVAELFQKIWKKYFEMDFLSKDNKLMGAIMSDILTVMCNYTDKSHVLCERVYKIGLYDKILSYLDSTYLEPGKTIQQNFKRTVNGLMAVLHNMLQKVSDSRQAMREKKAAEILQRFRSSPNEMVACKALILQAYVITEEENEIVNSDETAFKFMKKILENAFKHPDHRSDYGLYAIEIIAALNRLAVNDNNKVRIVSAGLLPLYVRMLQPQNSTAEQAAAAEGIWTLAFKCATEVEKEPECIQALQNLVNTSSDEVVLTQAKGALWMLDKAKNDSRAATDMSRSILFSDCRVGAEEGGGGGDMHIFISYQWDNQQVIKRLTSSLKEAGYNVWVDFDKMHGSILEAMAKAVENAVVVIMCVSEKYKESPNCRTEAEYSYRLHKDIIPLRLQPRYNPDGWLGAIEGNKLYYDFSSTDKYYSSFNALIKVLGDKGKASLAVTDIPDGQEIATPSKAKLLQSKIPSSVSNVGNWSTADVRRWLKDNGMATFQGWLHEVDGSLLMEYRSMRQNAPETFYSMLKENLFSLRDILRLSKALNQL